RSRLTGLFPDGKGQQHLHLHDAGAAKGLEVVFRRSPFTHEPIPGPYDLAGDEYKLLPPPAEIPIAPPEPVDQSPDIRPETPKPRGRTEFDLTSEEAIALGLPDPVPWHRKKLTGRLRKGPLTWGRDKTGR